MNKKFTISVFFILTFFFNISYVSANCDCESKANGNWTDPDTWTCIDMAPGTCGSDVPGPGDIVTILTGHTVTISESADPDLSGGMMFISIEDGGSLEFNPPPCTGSACDLDIILGDGSIVEVIGEYGITLGINAIPGQTRLYIGVDLILHANGDFPFGPGVLPFDAPLPVELASFYGQAMERSNMLKWQTESEENTMAFLVERSLDGRKDFIEIGRVDAIGNSTALRSYEIEDGNPVSLAYYRLRIVDFDGTFEFSDVIAIERSKTEIDLVEVYPVPAEEEITVLVHAKAAGKAIITLSDFMGRTIKEEKVELKAGINHYTLNFEEHETNFYYLTIYNGNERIAKKILRASKD